MLKSKIYIFLSIVFIAISCDTVLIVPLNDKLIFQKANQIEVHKYTYNQEGTSYTVLGDSLYEAFNIADTFNNEYELKQIDTMSSKPVLRWDSLGVKYIYAAIFNQPINSTTSVIKNPENIIWFWHSGMTDNSGYSQDGNVSYLSGKSVTNFLNDEFTEPVSLTSESVYYWGVWAWSNDGKEVKYSSSEFPFYVK